MAHGMDKHYYEVTFEAGGETHTYVALMRNSQAEALRADLHAIPHRGTPFHNIQVTRIQEPRPWGYTDLRDEIFKRFS